jgi:hypothetical protein
MPGQSFLSTRLTKYAVIRLLPKKMIIVMWGTICREFFALSGLRIIKN